MKHVMKWLLACLLAILAVVGIVKAPNYLVQTTLKTPTPSVTASGEVVSRKTMISNCLKDSMCKHLSEAGYFESKNQSDKGVVAVMFVVLNRVVDEKRWGNTVKGVLRERAQFSYVGDGRLAKGVVNKKRFEEIVVLAYNVTHGKISNPIGKANHFHATYVSPKWRLKAKFVKQIDDHIFYTL